MLGAMNIPIRALDHVVLRVADLDRALTFYCDVLGCVEERRLADLGLVQLRAGQSLIDLVDINAPLGQKGGAAPGSEGRNMDHFCLQVDPFDEVTIRTHLEKHGIHTEASETRYGAQGYGPSIYVEDPEGNVVELKGPATSDVT